MKIDFSQTVLSPDGQQTEFNIGHICAVALNATRQGAAPLSLEDAVSRGNLALRVRLGGDHEITPEEAALIRAQLPLIWAPIVVAQVAAVLA